MLYVLVVVYIFRNLISSLTSPNQAGVETMERSKAEANTVRRARPWRKGSHYDRERNAEAVKAVHEFPLFKIQDHQTGDLVEVEKNQF